MNNQTRSQTNFPNRRINLRIVLWSLAACLLLLPLAAMQVTTGVNWDGPDFAAAALLLGGAGLGIELAVRMVRNRSTRLALIGAVLLTLLLIWAELAVGIIR